MVLNNRIMQYLGQTKEGFKLAAQFYKEAKIKHDPHLEKYPPSLFTPLLFPLSFSYLYLFTSPLEILGQTKGGCKILHKAKRKPDSNLKIDSFLHPFPPSSIY